MLLRKEEFDFLVEMNKQAIKRHREGKTEGGEAMPRGARTVVGRVFKEKRWARRWAKGRRVVKVKGGYTIRKGKKRRGR